MELKELMRNLYYPDVVWPRIFNIEALIKPPGSQASLKIRYQIKSIDLKFITLYFYFCLQIHIKFNIKLLTSENLNLNFIMLA